MSRTAAGSLARMIRGIIEDQRVKALTDAELVRLFSELRDEVAFRGLLRRHGAMVLALCRNILGNEADADLIDGERQGLVNVKVTVTSIHAAVKEQAAMDRCQLFGPRRVNAGIGGPLQLRHFGKHDRADALLERVFSRHRLPDLPVDPSIFHCQIAADTPAAYIKNSAQILAKDLGKILGRQRGALGPLERPRPLKDAIHGRGVGLLHSASPL